MGRIWPLLAEPGARRAPPIGMKKKATRRWPNRSGQPLYQSSRRLVANRHTGGGREPKRSGRAAARAIRESARTSEQAYALSDAYLIVTVRAPWHNNGNMLCVLCLFRLGGVRWFHKSQRAECPRMTPPRKWGVHTPHKTGEFLEINCQQT